MMNNRCRFRTLVRIFALIFALAILGGCEQDVVIDPDWSVNLFKPGPKWPNVKKLPQEQQEAYQKYGKPDCFHVFWTPDGRLKRRSDLEKEFGGKKMKSIPPYSWVYSSQNLELIFQGGTYVERPLSEPLQILVRNGDPEDQQELYGGITQWQFFSTGKLYKLKDNRVIEMKEFTPMGKFIK